jgi:hypothetical protein
MKTLALLIACACPIALAETAPQTSAVWQSHEIDFAYMGFTSQYSCDGLADKMREILIAAGARPDAAATPGNCTRFDRPDPFARVHLRFSTLKPADSASASGNGSEAVGGVWRKVSLSDHRPFTVDTGDCELVEQFKRTVLANFTTRNVSEGPYCQPHQTTVGQPNLTFEVLTAPAGDKPGR